MKTGYLILISACIVTGSIVFSQPKFAVQNPNSSIFLIEDPNMAHGLNIFCAQGGSISGYHIASGETLENLEENVMKGIDDTNQWRPYSGVTYDPNNKIYLQVMVNSNDNFVYPD